jgi:RNA recognition motif-containing protein
MSAVVSWGDESEDEGEQVYVEECPSPKEEVVQPSDAAAAAVSQWGRNSNRGDSGGNHRFGKQVGGGSQGGYDNNPQPNRYGQNQRANARRREEHPPVPMPTQPPYKIYIRNLPRECTQEDLPIFFEEIKDSIVKIHLPRDQMSDSKLNKGWGFVEFKSLETMKQALGLNSYTFGGRRIVVEIARPERPRPSKDVAGSDTSAPAGERKKLNIRPRTKPVPEMKPRSVQKSISEATVAVAINESAGIKGEDGFQVVQKEVRMKRAEKRPGNRGVRRHEKSGKGLQGSGTDGKRGADDKRAGNERRGSRKAGAAVAGTSGEKPKGLSKARKEIPTKTVEPKAPVNLFAALGVDSDSD